MQIIKITEEQYYASQSKNITQNRNFETLVLIFLHCVIVTVF